MISEQFEVKDLSQEIEGINKASVQISTTGKQRHFFGIYCTLDKQKAIDYYDHLVQTLNCHCLLRVLDTNGELIDITEIDPDDPRRDNYERSRI